MNEDRLRIYVDDHVALLTGEFELIGRCRHENQQEVFADFLAALSLEVAEQRKVATDVLHRMGQTESKLKQSAAWLAEKFGRLKLNDSLVTYSPLARVLEFEGLSLTAMERISLWETLASGLDPRFDGLDFLTAKEQSERHLVKLRELRREAAHRAFFTAEGS